MTISVANVLTTDTFGSWLTKTNTLATIASQNAVTADASSGGSITTGNAYVNGVFGANTFVAYSGIGGGSLTAGNTLNLLTNTSFTYSGSGLVTFAANSSTSSFTSVTNSVSIVSTGGNTVLGGSFLNINASTTNVTSTSLNANSNLTVTGNSTFKANSSFAVLTVSGNSSVTTLLANTTNTTIVGNTSFANSVTVANAIIAGGLANVNQLNVRGAVTSNIAGDLRIEGSVSIGGNLAYSGTTGGDIIPSSNNFYKLGNTTNRFADVYSNNFYGTTTNTVSLIVTGNTSFANSLIPSANVTHSVGSSTLYWNQVFVANTNSNNVLVSNNVYVPAANVTAPAITFTGNTDTGLFRSATATVAVAAAGTQKLTVNSTFVAVNNALTVSSNVALSNTLSVTGAATLSNTLAVSGVTTLSANVSTTGTILINSVAHQFANTYTFSNSTAAANVDVVSAATYRSYEYTVQLSDTTVTPTARYHLTKILIVHDGTTPYITEYGTVFNSSSLGTFDAIINGGNIALQLTPTTANVVAKFTRTSIVP